MLPFRSFSLRPIATGLAAAWCIVPMAVEAASTIVRDGSLGAGPTTALASAGTVVSGSVSYRKITIPETYGQRSGGNVFHSFSNFSVGSGDGAVFTIDAPAGNVISRVTGGQASTINGLLSLDPGSTSSRPNFFFINPAGVTFGAGAAVDVPAAFHVSTADKLKFADGYVWDTGHATPSSLTVAAPESFGFLGNRTVPAKASFNNEDQAGRAVDGQLNLFLRGSTAFDVSAGAIDFSNANIVTTFGTINLASVGSETRTLPVNAPTFEPLAGPLSLSNSGLFAYGGSVIVRAGDLSLSNGLINTSNFSSQDAAPGSGVSIEAARLVLDSSVADYLGVTPGIASNATSSGKVGAIGINVRGEASILNGTQINSSAAFGTADGGNILLQAGKLKIDSGSSDANTGIFTDSTVSFGNAGNITVQVAGNFEMLNRGMISSVSQYGQNAGSVVVRAGQLKIDHADPALPLWAGINSDTLYGRDAGSITLQVAGGIDLLNGGMISSSSLYGGKAGRIDVAAERLKIDGASPTGIFVKALRGSTGDAGAINLNIHGDLDLLRGGHVSASTHSVGKAGNVTVNAGRLTIDTQGTGLDTGIFSEADAVSSGQVGSLSVTATDSIRLLTGGTLSIQNGATIADQSGLTPTALTVVAPNLVLQQSQITASSTGNVAASNVQISFSERLSTTAGDITTSANQGNGGAIRIQGGDGVISLDRSRITTSVQGVSGNGGNIDIQAKGVTLDTGFIQANTAARNARGGDVHIDVQTLVPSGNVLFKGGATAYGFLPGVFGFNVIQAAAPTGLSGSVDITAPALDISGTLTGLSARLLDAGGLGRNPCRIGGGSSLVQAGRGGFAPAARDLLGPGSSAAALPLAAGGPRLARISWGCDS